MTGDTIRNLGPLRVLVGTMKGRAGIFHHRHTKTVTRVPDR